ncbi:MULTISPECIES: DUF4125 family protein [Desulfobacula]|uniref:BssG2: conserved uncharacterized protein associated with anaerobic toluene degradation gene cluster n=2 Tax=Desulfobacula TaxID=28222 RepID=K0NFY2_DESTT|nr:MULTISPECIES: DUF4125 family protein [Desulfobacula]CCK78673.1 BssG2: conserved uncharacterized protein associated with anaerobic toluene degradation gene cluster [Desulfobacula toluolica Tol2]SDT88284.1 Protein of unknown function [Desulfobacula phenolica]
MDVYKRSREVLIKSILNIELSMFLKVNGESNAPCQEHPDAFRKIRGSIYEFWSDEMLESYFNDLVVAERSDRNLVFEKYARMDNKIPKTNNNPLIDNIVEIEQKWQENLKEMYPAIYNHTCRDMNLASDGSNFKVYLASELETYSDRTLKKYYDHVKTAFDKGENLSVEMLGQLAKKSGIESLEKLEQLMQADVN